MTVKASHSFSDRHHLYTLDLPVYITTSPEVKVQMYADDIKIYAAYDTTSKSEVQAAFSLSLGRVGGIWGLTINLNKCSLLHFGDSFSPRYEISETFLEGCSKFKELGVVL
ncbi:hypothetical protein COOONC_15544 [Cooperia oncophora]